MTPRARTVGGVTWTAGTVRVTAGLMVAILVSAMDASVVATAVPTIAGELGRFSLYPWLISGYLLTSTTTVPLWGRLADIHGRRRVLLAGLAWFVAASLLCGWAPDMAWLVAFRALQGVGAGCLLPVALTMVGDLFTIEQRARLQGVFSSVWAVAALAGPTLGAVFVATVGWRWIFWINLPIGFAAAALLWAHRDAPPAAQRGRLDYPGAVGLTAGIGLVLFGLDGAGSGSTPVWPLVAAGLITLAAFAVTQRRTEHATIPLSLLRNRVIGFAAAALLWAHRDAPPAAQRGRLDYLGAVSLTAGIGLVLFGLDGAGSGSTPVWPLVAAGLITLAAFAVTQRRTEHATIPLSLLRNRVIGPATAAAFLAGSLTFALSAFLPLYVQGVLQGTSFAAGAVVSVSSLGWTASAIFSGRVMLRIGYERLVVSGALSMVAGTAALVWQPPGAGIAWVAVAAFAVGLGMGQLLTPLLIVVQSVVNWSTRGTATALNQFSRTIGGAVGVSLLGLLLGARARAAATAHGLDPRSVANPLSSGGHLDATTAPLIAEALQAVFWVLLAISVTALAIGVGILLISRGRLGASVSQGPPSETNARASGRGGAR